MCRKFFKFYSLILIAALTLSLIPTSAFAADANSAESSEKADNIRIFFDGSLSTNAFLTRIIEQSEFTINDMVINDAPISGDVTLVSCMNNIDGSSKSIYNAEISIGVVFDETRNADGTVTTSPRAVYTKTETSDYDFSSEVEITLSITYEEGSIDGFAYLKLTGVSASFRRKDTTCSLSNKKVRGRYQGWTAVDAELISYTSPWYTSTSIAINGTPLENSSSALACWLYGDAACTVTRGNQTWNLEFTVVESDFAI